VVSAGKSLQQELLFGMSDQKAMILMALGVNPISSMRQSKFDPTKSIMDINSQIDKNTQNVPASLKSTLKNSLGISDSLAYGLSNINREDVVDRSRQISQARGQIGTEEWKSQFTEFKGTLLKTQASIDKALSTDLVTNAVLKYMDVKANTVTLVANSVEGLSNILTNPQNLSKTINNTLKENVPIMTQSYAPSENAAAAWGKMFLTKSSNNVKFGGSN
jgi:hypothetical protein